MKADLTGIGNIVIDHVVKVNPYPEENTKQRIDHHWFQVGGPVPTALVFATRLGHAASFIGTWSDDVHGKTIEADLEAEGIDFSEARNREPGRTGFAHIWVDPDRGTRTIVYSRGDAKPLGPEQIRADRWPGSTLLHLDG
ncbi:MAG: carbohydrate kinase family protein, partial [Verrucomicrobiota bacterium]